MIIPLSPGATMTPTPNGYIVTGGWVLNVSEWRRQALHDKRSADGWTAFLRRWIG